MSAIDDLNAGQAVDVLGFSAHVSKGCIHLATPEGPKTFGMTWGTDEEMERALRVLLEAQGVTCPDSTDAGSLEDSSPDSQGSLLDPPQRRPMTRAPFRSRTASTAPDSDSDEPEPS